MMGADVPTCVGGVTLVVGAKVVICTAEGDAKPLVDFLAIVSPCAGTCGDDVSGALCETITVGAGASVGTTVVSDAEGTQGEARGTIGTSTAAKECYWLEKIDTVLGCLLYTSDAADE